MRLLVFIRSLVAIHFRIALMSMIFATVLGGCGGGSTAQIGPDSTARIQSVKGLLSALERSTVSPVGVNGKVAGAPDFNGDGKADALWYNAVTGQTSVWLMNGAASTATAVLLTHPQWKVIATPDLDGDGKSDLLWYNTATGQTSAWLMNGTTPSSYALLLTDLNWKVIATPDFNGDGKADLLWYNASTGQTSVWLMNGTAPSSYALLLTDPNWKVIATPDFNGDGKADLLWSNDATGQTSVWLMNGAAVTATALLLTDPAWKVTGAPDLDGDGKSDLLWYNAATGQTSAWLMNGATPTSYALLLTDPNWKVIATPDFDGDGKSDLLWYNVDTGQTSTWLMNGMAASSYRLLLTEAHWNVAVAPSPRGVAHHVTDFGPSLASVSGTRLMVQERNSDGTLAPAKAWTMRGVVWSPAGVSTNTYPADPNNVNVRRAEFANWAAVDIPLMRRMNVNTVRLLIDPGFDATLGPAGLAMMDAFHAAGIKVVMNVDDGSNNIVRLPQTVNYYKNHPALLMWMIGSEWNIGQNGGYYFGKFSTIQAAASATQQAAALIKTLDVKHPVATSYGAIDINASGLRLADTQSYVNAICTSVDVWGLNIYSGRTLGDLFSSWKSITTKAMFVGEFGTDAFRTTSETSPPIGVVDEAMQAAWVLSEWNDILRNTSAANASNVAIGGTVFEWNDEYWKVAPPGSQQTNGFHLAGGHPDDFANEEYFGIVSISRTTRAIFDSLKTAFAVAYVPPPQAVSFQAKSQGAGTTLGQAKFLRDGVSFYNLTGGAGGGRGFNVAAFTPGTLKLIDARNFDTYNTRGNGDAMASMINFVSALPISTVLLVAVADEAGLNMNDQCTHLPGPWIESGIRLFESLGSNLIRGYCFRNSWAMTVVKGAPGGAQEALMPGGQEVTASITATLQ